MNIEIKTKITGWIFRIWALIIGILAIIPKTPSLDFGIKKLHIFIRMDYVMHFGQFGLLTLLFCFYRFIKFKKISSKIVIVYFFLSSLYALATELVQIPMAERSFNPKDLYFNLAGIIVGLLISILILPVLRQKINFNSSQP